jgi:hypothetical protein
MISTLLTAALIIGAIFILSYLFNRLHKKQQQKQLSRQKKILYTVIQQHNLRIHQREDINNYLFGIDKSGGQLLHLDFRNPPEEATLIDLHKVESAKLVNVESGIYENKKGKAVLAEKYITKMQLELTLKDPSLQPVMLPLYQFEDGSQDLISLRQRGEYWQAVINSCVLQLAGDAPAKGVITF